MSTRTKRDLTGRWRFRQTMTGLLVLQVEIRKLDELPGDFYTVWRDAKPGEEQDIKLE